MPSSIPARPSRSRARWASAISCTRPSTSPTASPAICWALCEASGIACGLEFAEIPVDPQVSQLVRAGGGDALSLALHGGEDYQLLLAAPAERVAELGSWPRSSTRPFTVLGQFREGAASVFLRVGGRHMPLERVGHDHFEPSGADGT